MIDPRYLVNDTICCFHGSHQKCPFHPLVCQIIVAFRCHVHRQTVQYSFIEHEPSLFEIPANGYGFISQSFFGHLGELTSKYFDDTEIGEDLFKGYTVINSPVFGEGFQAMFVFAYGLSGDTLRWPTLRVHLYEGAYYAFYGISIAAYQAHCRPRSGRWKTVSLPTRVFRELAYPIDERLSSA